MPDLAGWLGSLVEHHRFWVGFGFALIAFAESTAFLGIVIPATPVLFLTGSLLGSGRLELVEIVPGAIIGAIAGYGLSYIAGKLAGREIAAHRWLRNRRRGIALARLFFRRHGIGALLFGRYVLGPFQSLVPFVAGAGRMDARRFWLVNILSGVIWVIVTLAPGYLLARGMSGMPDARLWEDRLNLALTAISGGAILICGFVAAVRLWQAQRSERGVATEAGRG